MNIIKAAIIGSGNIGCDLAERLLKDSNFEIVALVGRNANSSGLERFKARIPVSSEGIEGLRKHTETIEGIFDASSAQSAVANWQFAQLNNKWLIDLTPSYLGPAFVPSIAGQVTGIEIAKEFSHNYSMVTCGGQTAAPIVHAITSCMDQVNQIEVSSSIAAKSVGIATRNNINEYIEATERLLSNISNCKDVKAILILNPSIPPVLMRTTVTIGGTGARFFQASTSEIYGDPTISPQPEEYWGNVNPIGIRSCYDEGKRAAETLTFDYHRQFGLDIRVARIFNTYGPRMAANDGRVVSNFIVQALKGDPITVYGDGTQTRSFCYVDDLIDGFIKLFFKEGVIEPINLGNPEPINILELANEVIELTGSKSKIEMKELPGDDPRQREPKIDKARDLLGWSPSVKRKDGLRKTVDYFNSNLI